MRRVRHPVADSRPGLAIEPGGQITLAGAGCGDTALQRAEFAAWGPPRILTATVAADLCRLFDGRTSVTWVRVL